MLAPYQKIIRLRSILDREFTTHLIPLADGEALPLAVDKDGDGITAWELDEHDIEHLSLTKRLLVVTHGITPLCVYAVHSTCFGDGLARAKAEHEIEKQVKSINAPYFSEPLTRLRGTIIGYDHCITMICAHCGTRPDAEYTNGQWIHTASHGISGAAFCEAGAIQDLRRSAQNSVTQYES